MAGEPAGPAPDDARGGPRGPSHPDDRQRGRGGVRVASMGLALDLGVRLGVSIVIGVGAGLFVDGWLHTSPLFTLLGVALGVGAAMYTIWDVARQAMRN